MRYTTRKTEKKEDYTKGKYQPCWSCKNCLGGCSWSKDGTPVEGWQATPHTIRENRQFKDTYRISYCPLYERG